MVLRKRALAPFTIIIACLVGLTALPSAQRAAHPTRILVLDALPPDSPTRGPFLERMSTTLRSELPPPVEVYVEFLDLDRFPDPTQTPRLTRYLGEKYGGFGIDVVIAVGSVALQFATEQPRTRTSPPPSMA